MRNTEIINDSDGSNITVPYVCPGSLSATFPFKGKIPILMQNYNCKCLILLDRFIDAATAALIIINVIIILISAV